MENYNSKENTIYRNCVKALFIGNSIFGIILLAIYVLRVKLKLW